MCGGSAASGVVGVFVGVVLGVFVGAPVGVLIGVTVGVLVGSISNITQLLLSRRTLFGSDVPLVVIGQHLLSSERSQYQQGAKAEEAET